MDWLPWNHVSGAFGKMLTLVAGGTLYIDEGKPVPGPMWQESLQNLREVAGSYYVNVPLEQMTGFTEGIFEQAAVPEPSKHTQEMYAILDSVVQAVLTDENADIDALLADAQTQVQALIDADAAAAAAQ